MPNGSTGGMIDFMEEKDLKQIREVFREELKEVWEGNIEPAFVAIDEKLTVILKNHRWGDDRQFNN